ncbi:hypothetical protein MN608_05952 [Microdochium nivale]|nr:hypothetical protein MN608_05952 [Microdochium nivale]
MLIAPRKPGSMPRFHGRGRAPKIVPTSYIEEPTQVIYKGRFYAETQLVDPTRRSSAYDDQIKPVRHYRPSTDGKKTGLGFPWDNKQGIEKPLLPLHVDRAKYSEVFSCAAVKDGEARKRSGLFSKIPLELLDEILRYMLLWPRKISLFKGWSVVYPHSKPRLRGVSFLRTCRHLHDRGVGFLYGENRFVYEIRDPAESDRHAQELIRRNLYAECQFPFVKHGCRVRYVHISIEPGRVALAHNRSAFIAALEKFLPTSRERSRIHTLSVEIPALVDPAAQRRHMGLDEENIPICAFFDKSSQTVKIIKQLQPIFLQLRVPADGSREGDDGGATRFFYAVDIDLRGCFGEEEDYEKTYFTKDMRTERQKRITHSRAVIANLSMRLFHLATDPESRLSKAMWNEIQEFIPGEEQICIDEDEGSAVLRHGRRGAESKQKSAIELTAKLQSGMNSQIAAERRKKAAEQQSRTMKWLAGCESGAGLADHQRRSVPPEYLKDNTEDHLPPYTKAQSAGPPDVPTAVQTRAILKHACSGRRMGQARRGARGVLRCCTPEHESQLHQFGNDKREMSRHLRLLAAWKTDKGPLKRSVGGRLRASNAKTSKIIRMKLRRRELRKIARRG